ncbi:MAG: hypothetical protein HQK52_12310 [Oligoflexia bacterium]|nr:hypothetical protein [Oligoflexia bacterium]
MPSDPQSARTRFTSNVHNSSSLAINSATPIAYNLYYNGDQGVEYTINLSYSDPLGRSPGGCLISDLNNITVVRNCLCTGSGCLVAITTDNDFVGEASFSYELLSASTGAVYSNKATVTIVVAEVDDTPTADGTVIPVGMLEDVATEIILSYRDQNGDKAVGCKAYYSEELREIKGCSCSSSTGLCSVTMINSTPNYNGLAALTYQVRTNTLIAAPTGVITIYITPVDDPPMAFTYATPSALIESETPVAIVLLSADVDSSPVPVCTVTEIVGATPSSDCYCTPTDGNSSCKMNFSLAEASSNLSYLYRLVDTTPSTPNFSHYQAISIPITNTLDLWAKIVPTPDSFKGTPAPRSNLSVACTTNARGEEMLWFYGGDYSGNGGNILANDLWSWSASSKKFALSKGTPNSGTPVVGIASIPGSRSGAAIASVGENFYIYGGYGYDFLGDSMKYLNDLWKYQESSGEWSRVAGELVSGGLAIYDTENSFSSAARPGSRSYASMGSKGDGSGLWLYGGYGYAGTPPAGSASGTLADLWLYRTSDNMWAYVHGSKTINNGGSCIGISAATRGTPSSSIYPGARYNASVAVEPTSNALWMFGGNGYGCSDAGPGRFNDLWRFHPDASSSAAGIWSYESGTPNASDVEGVYGTRSIPSTTNIPAARYGHSMWGAIDAVSGDYSLYVFGGYGSAGGVSGYLNDLWRYNTRTREWTWLAGSSSVDSAESSTGSGIFSSSNTPRGKAFGGFCSGSSKGKFWIFGGSGVGGIGTNNELWKFD